MSANQTFSRTEFLRSVGHNKEKSKESNTKSLIQSDQKVIGLFFPTRSPRSLHGSVSGCGPGGWVPVSSATSPAQRLSCLAHFGALLAGICSLQAASPLLKRRAVVICSILGK